MGINRLGFTLLLLLLIRFFYGGCIHHHLLLWPLSDWILFYCGGGFTTVVRGIVKRPRMIPFVGYSVELPNL